ncbi:hypothetical protein SVAN01_06936 [Stagonosporopsis vannaccii]|nr:hypothetical protein SVAN01_06936 [Stagonosporopsis vannaccii]
MPGKDCAKNLLLTCKAVWPRVKLPWQLANIQSFDITLQQVMLEGDYLFNFCFNPTAWQPEAQHKGAFVEPYIGLKNTTGGSYRSCNFTLLPTDRKDDKIRLQDTLGDTHLPAGFQAPTSDMRLLRARPLVYLTLRMLRDQWWTWADEPDSTDAVNHHLGLDPAVGDGLLSVETRPSCPRMQELARQRRDGYYPGSKCSKNRSTPGWGHIISKMPNIKILKLIFETFKDKTARLENFINCSKTWRFPIADTQYELVWNGKVEAIKWSEPLVEDRWARTGARHARKTEFEVRIIRFTRRQMRS